MKVVQVGPNKRVTSEQRLTSGWRNKDYKEDK